jgi:hypothetical protein
MDESALQLCALADICLSGLKSRFGFGRFLALPLNKLEHVL